MHQYNNINHHLQNHTAKVCHQQDFRPEGAMRELVVWKRRLAPLLTSVAVQLDTGAYRVPFKRRDARSNSSLLGTQIVFSHS